MSSRIYLYFLENGFEVRRAFAKRVSSNRSWLASPSIIFDWFTALAEFWSSANVASLLATRKVGGLDLGHKWRKAVWAIAIYYLRSPVVFIGALTLACVLFLMLFVNEFLGLTRTSFFLLFLLPISLGYWSKNYLTGLKQSRSGPVSQIDVSAPKMASRFSAWAFLVPFLGVVLFFKTFDVATTHYMSGGVLIVLYNIFKTILCFYLLVIFHSAGTLFSLLPGLRGITEHLSILEAFLLRCFVGMGVLSTLYFVLGAMGWLSVPLAVAISAPLVFISQSRAAEYATALYRAVGRLGAMRDGYGVVTAEIVSLFFIVLFVFLVRGLFPGDLSYDEVAHYQPYIKTVIENGGTQFNDYWYHFYISKGAGLFFLGALLGDIHTPLIVSFIAFGLTGLGLGYLVHRATGAIEWTLLALIIYFVAPGVPGYEVFLRMNLMSGAFVTGVVFSVLLLPKIPLLFKIRWSILCLPIYIGFMTLTPTAAAFLTPFLGIYFIFAIFRGRFLHAFDYMTWAVVSVFTVFAMLWFNFVVTGLAEGTPLRTFFSFADQSRLNEFVSSYLVVFIEEASKRGLGQLNLIGLLRPDLSKINYILQAYRYEFMFAGGFLFWYMVIWTALARAGGRQAFNTTFAPLWPGFLFIGIALTMAQVNQQDQSVLRFLFSAKIFIIAFPIVLWKVSIELLPRFRFRRGLELLTVTLFAAWAIGALGRQTVDFNRYPYYFKFLTGQIGFMESYRAMDLKSGVWNSCLKAREMTGPDDKLLFMNVTVKSGACHMMPDRQFRLELGNGFGGLWHDMVFSDKAEDSIRAYKKAGITHFLFDPAQPLFACSAYSVLFRPENIGRYFQLAEYTHAGVIFTWRTPGAPPIPKPFIRKWKRHLARTKPWEMGEMCRRVAGYYRKYGLQTPVRQDLSLRPLRSWQ